MKSKHCEVYRRMYDVYRRVFFNKKIFTDELNMGLPQQTWFKKQFIERKYTDSLVKK